MSRGQGTVRQMPGGSCICLENEESEQAALLLRAKQISGNHVDGLRLDPLG